jgi:hypothetical protein
VSEHQDPKFQDLMQATIKLIMLVSNPGTEVDNRTRSRLRGRYRMSTTSVATAARPEEICAALEKLLTLKLLLAPPDALLLDPLRSAYDAYDAYVSG